MYFKASISVSTESLWMNPETNEYEGCDPDSFQYFGVVRELTAPTLLELRQKIEREYFNLEKPIGADVQIFENRIEIQYQGEYNYRTPKEDRIPFIETASICISKVMVEEVDLASEDIFSKISKY